MITIMWPGRYILKDYWENIADLAYVDYDEEWRYRHHDSLESFSTSVQKACYICYRIHLIIGHKFPDYNSDRTLFDAIRPFTLGHWTYSPNEKNPWNLEIIPSAGLLVVRNLLSQIEGLGKFRIFSSVGLETVGVAASSTTEISVCGNVVKHWIKTCNELHPGCALKRKPNWYPTRLLDLHNTDTTGHIKLIHTTQHQPTEDYATLSHCWGGASLVKLTTATLAQFSSKINVSDLPRTFNDAIKVALFLGIRYVWIDALTILQDSPEDWAQEASLMADVYQNASINFGATASSDSNGGLFFERNPDLVNPQRFKIELCELLVLDRSQWYFELTQQPLLRRGWVTQERWLCPRMLHFSGNQLFWECSNMVGCEATPESSHNDLHSNQMSYRFKSENESDDTRVGRGIDVRRTERRKRLFDQWDKIITQYSGSNLTFESDKLVAISGLAKRFHRELGDEYIAGLWESELIFQMAWTTYEANTGSQGRTGEYIAPSWSWASMNCSCYSARWRIHDTHQVQMFAQPLDYNLEYRDTNTFGQLKGGFVKIRAPLHMSLVSSSSFPSQAFRFCIEGSWHDVGREIWIDVGNRKGDWEETIFFLPLYSIKSENDSGLTAAILLLHREACSEARFSRVGIFYPSEKELVQSLSRISRIGSLPEEAFNPDHGYTVNII
jgi:hypothetical protein